MEMPDVKTVATDEQAGVRYEVMAYRKMTDNEMIFAIRMYHSQRRKKKLKKGTLITIMSIIGHNE